MVVVEERIYAKGTIFGGICHQPSTQLLSAYHCSPVRVDDMSFSDSDTLNVLRGWWWWDGGGGRTELNVWGRETNGSRTRTRWNVDNVIELDGNTFGDFLLKMFWILLLLLLLFASIFSSIWTLNSSRRRPRTGGVAEWRRKEESEEMKTRFWSNNSGCRLWRVKEEEFLK